jgi:hypothetical protein
MWRPPRNVLGAHVLIIPPYIPVLAGLSHLFLQQGERAGRIQCRRPMHMNCLTNIIAQAINKAHSEIYRIGVFAIGDELFNDFGVLSDVFRNGARHMDVKQLAN